MAVHTYVSVLAYEAPTNVVLRELWALGQVQWLHSCVTFLPMCCVQATALSKGHHAPISFLDTKHEHHASQNQGIRQHT